MSEAAAGPVHRALSHLGPRGRADAPVGPLTTYRVGGRAAVLATVSSLDDVEVLVGAVASSGLPVLVIGRGSNLLVADRGFPGIAVILEGPAFTAVDLGPMVEGQAEVTAGAAVPLPTLARRSADGGLTGMEWAVGVPGSVGGGIRMNAGGHGADMAASVVAATVVHLGDRGPGLAPTGVAVEWSLADLAYGYRTSSIGPLDLVLSARFAATAGDPQEARATIRQIVRWRREHQPGGQNAGSVFTNPPGDSAGRLVEAAGQKGRRLGSAAVSTKHANFIQADPGGSADDVRALIEAVRMAVLTRFDLDLHPEVRLVGFDDPCSLSSTGRGCEGG